MKIAVDTNIILRIMTCDDEKLLSRARNLVKRHGGGDIYVCYAVMMETHYVLSKYYKYSPVAIVEAFKDLMRIEQFHFEHETAVRLALARQEHGFSFADSLIGEIGNIKNLKTYTFDKALKRNSSFIILSD